MPRSSHNPQPRASRASRAPSRDPNPRRSARSPSPALIRRPASPAFFNPLANASSYSTASQNPFPEGYAPSLPPAAGHKQRSQKKDKKKKTNWRKQVLKFERAKLSFWDKVGIWLMGTTPEKLERAAREGERRRERERERRREARRARREARLEEVLEV